MCIAFEIPSGKTAKIFYKFENESECKDWFELLQLVSRESIGPCKFTILLLSHTLAIRDTTQIPFRDYFRDITTCGHQPNTVISLDAGELSKRQAEWNWMISNGSTGGMKYTGDIECDDAVDGIWNIDNGRIAHEESYEILRVILLRCHNLIAEDLLECEKNDDTSPSYANTKIKAFLTSISSIPLWLDENLLKEGASLIMSNIIWLFVAYLDRTFMEILSSQEGISLMSAIAAGINISKECNTKDENTDVEEELLAKIVITSKEADLFLKKVYGILIKTLIAASTNCLKPFSAVAIDFLDLRIELSLLRRKILSICGVGRWNEDLYGMPFSQYFLGRTLGLFALHSIQILRSLRFGILSTADISAILHFW